MISISDPEHIRILNGQRVVVLQAAMPVTVPLSSAGCCSPAPLVWRYRTRLTRRPADAVEALVTRPQMPPVLVTGATGRVGRAVVAQLLDAGVPVRALAPPGG